MTTTYTLALCGDHDALRTLDEFFDALTIQDRYKIVQWIAHDPGALGDRLQAYCDGIDADRAAAALDREIDGRCEP